MNLGDFHTTVSNALRRGTSLDAVIPTWVSMAARVLEQNYTFSWMRRRETIIFPAGDVPLVYALDPNVKSVNWIKPILDEPGDGTEWYGTPLVGVDDASVLGINGGNPSGYWLDGEDGVYALNLDAIPRDEYRVKISWNKYTDWPVDPAASPTLLVRGQACLLFQTLILFANLQRDARMADQYGAMLQEGLNVLLRSEEEFKLQHQNDLKMEYSGLQ